MSQGGKKCEAMGPKLQFPSLWNSASHARSEVRPIDAGSGLRPSRGCHQALGWDRRSSLYRTAAALALYPLLLAGPYADATQGARPAASNAIGSSSGESFAERKLKEIVKRQEAIFDRIEEDGGEYHQGDFEVAMRSITHQYEDYLLNNPEDVIGYILYGKLLNKLGETEHAVRQFLKADQIDPKIHVVKQQLGNYMAEHGKFQEALGFFTQAVELSPETALYYYQIAEVMNLFRENIVLSGLFTRDELDCHMQEAFATAASLDPENRLFRFRYAESFYDVEAPDWETALQSWEALQEVAQPGLEVEAILLHRANALAELGRFEEAEALSAQVIEPSLAMSNGQVLEKIAQGTDSTEGNTD